MTSAERLTKVLEQWRLTWSPRLSELALKLEVDVAPLSDDAPTQQLARAQQLAALADSSADLTRSAVLDACKVFAANALHANLVVALDSWKTTEPDPRVAAFALDLLSRKGAMRETTHALAEVLLEIVTAHGDTSTVPLLEQWMTGGAVHHNWRPKIRRAIRALKKRKAFAVDEKMVAALEEGATVRRAPAVKTLDGEALLEAIYAAPSDDAPRLAWADWLTESGDPLGEFIVLQINHARGKVPPAANKREKVLLTQLRSRLLGELASCVALNSVKFSRGFLSRVEFKWNEIPVARALELLEEIEVGRTSSGRLPQVAWRALRRAREVPVLSAGALLAGAPALEELRIASATWAAYEENVLGLVRPTALRVLRLGVARPIVGRWPVLLASKIFQGLERIEFRMEGTQWSRDPNNIPPAVLAASALASVPPSVNEVCVDIIEIPVRVRFLRRSGTFSAVRMEFDEQGSSFKTAHVANGVLSGMKDAPIELLEVHGFQSFSEDDFGKLIARTRAWTKELRCTWDD